VPDISSSVIVRRSARRVVRHRPTARRPPEAVLFDRDGTLVVDVPYNGDPARVRPVPGAGAALDLLRTAGMPVGVVTNQSGIARGLITPDQADAVNRRVEALLGPFALWEVCPHGPGDGCPCRKPRPGLVLAATRRLGVAASRTVVVGDIGADVEAAAAAGAAAVLVPTPVTRPEEVAAAPVVRPDLGSAVRHLLGHDPDVEDPDVEDPDVEDPDVKDTAVEGAS
jgi:D-glycero-D-manno-heptose 1,7-bisphosphate phosphatase